MDGLFLELGPLKLSPEGEVTLNPHSWHRAANLLFVDQPVGTGLAYTRDRRYPKTDQEVNAAFYQMLLAFFALHPAYVTRDPASGLRTTRPVILSGQ
jgi:carboxypeptidase D